MHRLAVPTFLLLASAFGVAAAANAAAETVRLRTGQTLIGDVTLSGDDVVVDVRFPTEHKTSHELHRLILEAQATSWRGGRAPAR